MRYSINYIKYNHFTAQLSGLFNNNACISVYSNTVLGYVTYKRTDHLFMSSRPGIYGYGYSYSKGK